MIGRAVSHYRVLSPLGSGGMGVVYLAEDERLGRQVALKFLPPESAASHQALERFRVEARAASSLSHPGICAIFDIGDDDGTPYIVMEALRGESLRDRINRGPLKVADLLDISIQLADALDAAHAQGIIHRDIKPSNIFIGDKNRTKILDFGLAKLAQASGPRSSDAATRALNASTHRDLTIPGSALGTVSYMSPEQARGEEVDTRTDLFSLGVVLYEMSTGIQAFGGSTQAIVFDAILNRTPHPISHINPSIPPRLESLITTALEKERELRHQHASDLEAELKRIRRDLESGSLAAVSRTTVSAASGDRRLPATPSSSTPEVAPAKSRAWIWIAAGALVVLALAYGGYSLWSDTESQQVAVATPPAQTPVAPPVEVSPPPPTPAPAEPAPAPSAVQPKPQETAPPVRPTPQPQQPVRPTPEPRPQTTQPTVTPQPQRPQATAPASGPVTVTPPAATPSPSLPPPPQPTQTQAPAPVTPAQTPPPTVAQPQPAQVDPPPPVTQQPATQQPAATPPPPRQVAAPTPTPSTPPPTSPVESDEAQIRGVLRTYERAIETKSVDLFRSVRPGLSAVEESRLRASFSQVDSQQVDITVDDLRMEGRTATVRISRRDSIMNSGRRQTSSIRQTLRLEKAAGGWIITEIR
jgi:serine/threonine protein kinase